MLLLFLMFTIRAISIDQEISKRKSLIRAYLFLFFGDTEK